MGTFVPPINLRGRTGHKFGLEPRSRSVQLGSALPSFPGSPNFLTYKIKGTVGVISTGPRKSMPQLQRPPGLALNRPLADPDHEDKYASPTFCSVKSLTCASQVAALSCIGRCRDPASVPQPPPMSHVRGQPKSLAARGTGPATTSPELWSGRTEPHSLSNQRTR